MKKRILAVTLLASMMMGTMASVAVQAEDMPTLSLHIPTIGTYTEDAIQLVEDTVSAYAAEKYGFKIDLVYTEIGNFMQATNLAMTTDEVDVTCYFAENGGLANLVNNGQLLEITEWFATGASEEFRAIFTEAELATGNLMGRQYSVPRKYQGGGKNVALFNKAMIDELGIDPKSVTSMEELGEVLRLAKEKYPDVYAIVPQTGPEMTYREPWDEYLGGASFLYAEDCDSTELESVFELDSFREFCNYTHEWYQEGLMMQDAISNTMEGAELVKNGTAFACLHNTDIDPQESFWPGVVESGDIVAPMCPYTDLGALQYAVSANSKYPEESLVLLEAIYTDAELATTLAFGVEGEHWVRNEEGKAEFPEGVTAETLTYGGLVVSATYPNYLIFPVRATAIHDDYNVAVNEWNEKLNTTESMGWYFDTTEYTDFVTAYANLEEKYLFPLQTGSIALDDVLPQIQEELKELGFYEILAEAQAQFDEFLASK